MCRPAGPLVTWGGAGAHGGVGCVDLPVLVVAAEQDHLRRVADFEREEERHHLE